MYVDLTIFQKNCSDLIRWLVVVLHSEMLGKIKIHTRLEPMHLLYVLVWVYIVVVLTISEENKEK